MKTIEQYIDTEMPGKIARKRNSPFLALLVLAVGIGMWALLCTVKMVDSLSATCLTLGLICTALGLILTACQPTAVCVRRKCTSAATTTRMSSKPSITEIFSHWLQCALLSVPTLQYVSSPVVTVNVYSFKPSGTRVAILSQRPRCAFSQARRLQVLFT